MRPPVGMAEIRAMYGDPRVFVKDDGTVSPLWERRMVSVALPSPLPLGWRVNDQIVMATRVRVNEAIAAEVEALLRTWEESGLWTCLDTYDGGYVWRPKRTSSHLSMHSYGAALDFNAATNPMGTSGCMDLRLVVLAESKGWTWGGRWARPDPMHFQYGTGY